MPLLLLLFLQHIADVCATCFLPLMLLLLLLLLLLLWSVANIHAQAAQKNGHAACVALLQQ